MTDTFTEKFNEAILVSMMEEACKDIEMAVTQYQLIDSKLRGVRLRLLRAMRSNKVSSILSLEQQRDVLQGVMCMYGQYLQKKLHKLGQIRQYRQERCDN